jgi:multidrug efflux system membrane fusion protein
MILLSRRSLRLAWSLPLLAIACRKPPPASAPPISVTVATADRRPMPVEVTAPGTVEPYRSVAVEAQVSGLLTAVEFREGDQVRDGQILFRIDPRPFEAALAQTRAMLARDLAQSVNAEQNLVRLEALLARDYVTQAQVDDARSAALGLRSTLAADSAAVEAARLNLQYATIQSPLAGRAGAIYVKAGNLVRSGSGTPLVVINQTRPALVRFALPATDLDQIRQAGGRGLTVRVRATGDTSMVRTGGLVFIDNAVDTTTGTILLKASFPNTDDALWPGEFVEAWLQLAVEPNAVVVPAPALVSGQQGTFVFVVGPDGRAHTRPVQSSRTVQNLAVITKGLEAGEQIVTDGQIRLTEGAKVQIRSGGTGAAP